MSNSRALHRWGPIFLWWMSAHLGFAAEAQQTFTDSSTKVTFPSEVSISHEGKNYRLPITGVATRTKFFVNVYSVAHYMEDPPEGAKNTIFELILTDLTKAKQLTIQWVRAVDLEKIHTGFLESFEKTATSDELQALRPAIDQFLSFYTKGATVGDQHILQQLPGGHIFVIINGKESGHIQNPLFAKALWAIWLGPKSVVSRTKLISLLKGPSFVQGDE